MVGEAFVHKLGAYRGKADVEHWMDSLRKAGLAQ